MSGLELSKTAKLSRIFIPIVCLIGALFAGISLYNHTALMSGLQTGPSFCNISAHINCDAVSQSRFSKVFGLPLDGYGLAFYLCLLALSFIRRGGELISEKTFQRVFLVLSLLASVASVVLFLISEFVIGALCILCMGMYFANFTLLAISLALSREEPLGSRINGGVLALIGLPLLLLSKRNFASSLLWVRTWVVAIGMAAIVYGTFKLPVYFESMIAARSPEMKQIEEVMKIAINDWENQVPVDIEVHEESGIMRDYTRGPAFAPLQLVEFSDYQCPACRYFHGKLEELLKEYGDKVRFVHRNYPLDRACNPEIDRDMHRNACLAANFARCAGEQGKFWQASDYLFRLEEMDKEASKEEVDAGIMHTAEALNLDGRAIADCLQSGRQMQKIQQDLIDGNRLGLQGTPSLWLNGRKVKVANAVILKRLFDLALSRNSK
jgi:protein-disulfide isomerase/uncharacterized membrane protein